jgi:inosine-uridine nucleoside N-ribohydrolase
MRSTGPRHRLRLPAIAVLAACLTLVAGCATPSPTTPATAATRSDAAPSSPASPATAVRPVVIDTDLAADDVLAIMVLLRDPGVDVRAIAVDGTGEVRCPAGVRNARRLVAAFGRSDIPVACGRENPGPGGRWFPTEWRDGADAFYGVELPEVDGEATRTGEQAPALLTRLAADARAAGDPLTIVALGPWTNLADALAADPAFATNLAGIHAMGGTIDAPGNIDIETTSPADQVEWNFGVDPAALAAVLATDVPVTMVGLDATNDVPVPGDVERVLAADTKAAGADIAHEVYLRNPFLVQGSSFWDTLAAVLVSDASVATWEDVTVRVETQGRAAGRTVRDEAGRTVHAAMHADRDRFMATFLAALRSGDPRRGASRIAGALTADWDGNACRIGEAPSAAGDVVLTFRNASNDSAGLALVRVVAPHTWAEALRWAQHADLGDATLVQPGWIVPVENAPAADAGGSATSVAKLEPGSYGAACLAGDWPDVTFTDGGAFELEG